MATEALDQDVLRLSKAIRQVETGNKPIRGASGELASRYQFMPGTWRGEAKRILGDANAPLTLENENKVAYTRIKEKKDAGWTPDMIASWWNSGGPTYEGKVGVNKMGVKYDVPGYVNKVKGAYQQLKEAEGVNQVKSNLDVSQIEQPEKKPGFFRSLFDTTLGKQGLGGHFAMLGRIAAQPGLLKDTTALNESLGGLAEQTMKLQKAIQDETDPVRAARLRQMLEANQQTMAQGRVTGRKAEQGIIGPRDTISTTANSALLAATGGGGVARQGIIRGAEAIAPKVAPAVTRAVSVGRGLLPRAVEQAGIGVGFQASQNIAEGRPLLEGAGKAAAFGIALPVLGTGMSKVGTKLQGAKNEASERIINSLIKPLQKDLSYGKNPARGVLSEGIVANSLEDLANQVSNRRGEIGKQIGEMVAASDKPIILTDALKPIKEELTKARRAPNTNKDLINRLEGVLADLNEAIGPDRYYANPSQTFAIKKLVGDITKFTGNASDDKAVNAALKRVYGRLKERLNEAVPGVSELNERYADLTSAEVAARYRDRIETKQNLVSLRGVGLGGSALLTAVLTGGATVPTILAGIVGSQLDRILGNAAVKTRIAQWLSTASQKEKATVFTKIPGLKNALTRIFGEEPKLQQALQEAPDKPLLQLGAGSIAPPAPKNLGSKVFNQAEARAAQPKLNSEGSAKLIKNLTGKKPMASSAPTEGSLIVKTTGGQYFLMRKGFQPSRLNAQEANELKRAGYQIMQAK